MDEAPGRPIDMRAAEYVERRDSAQWTPADEVQFEDWLNESSAHRVAFMRLNASWKRTERLVALRTPDLPRPHAEPRATGGRFLRVAVLAAVVVGAGGWLASYLRTPHYDRYATTVGGHETLALHDGSKIELNTDTVVRISQTAKKRLVMLDRGEAYFQVRHDETRPFVVVTDAGRIIDLGTKFSAQSDNGHLKVSLVEGRIRFEAQAQDGREKTTTLVPGDVLLASAGSVSVTRAPLPELTSDLAWRKGMLIFRGTTLADAAREFNRYNETKIVIDDPKAGHETINGALPANDLEEFERMAANIFGLKARKRANEIIFSR
jgi:transmembrane sensor